MHSDSISNNVYLVDSTLSCHEPCAGWQVEGPPSRHRVGGQWLFTVYAHAPSTFRPPHKSMFADVYIKDTVDKVEWAQHSVVSAQPCAVLAGCHESVKLPAAQLLRSSERLYPFAHPDGL